MSENWFTHQTHLEDILNPGRVSWPLVGFSEVREKEGGIADGDRGAPIEPPDVPEAGRLCHDAFKAIARQHNFSARLHGPDVAINLLSRLTANLGFYGVVAQQDGRIVGSNFVDERSPIIGLGPITVDPAAHNQGVGAALMRHMVDRAARNQAAGLRLVQSGYHLRSLCLYTKLGFAVREHLANLQGPPIGITIPGCTVRRATGADAATCDLLCRAVHGHERGRDLRDAVDQGAAPIVERNGRITGYDPDRLFSAMLWPRRMTI